jgi:hypothetical protein
MSMFMKFDRALSVAVDGECLSVDQLTELAEIGKRTGDFDHKITHVASCSHCFSLYREFRGVEAARTEPMLGVLRLSAGKALEGAAKLPIWVAEMLQVLRGPLPSHTYRAAAQASSVQLLNPIVGNRAITRDERTIRWDAGGAANVDVLIERMNGTIQPIAITAGNGDSADLPDLAPGRYRIRIRPQADDSDWLGSGNEAEFCFEALSVADSDRVRWAHNAAAATPVAASIVLYNLGRYADAVDMLDRWPDTEEANNWRFVLEAAHQDRLADPSR